jgi:hypothetical protein
MRLSYMVTQTPLVSAEQSEFASRVRVMYGEGQDERQLREARTVRVRLVNRSSKDITTAMFDDGSPLVIDLGVPVVATLSEQHVGPSRPVIDVAGSQIQLRPGKIARSEAIIIDVLVDGRPAVSADSPLIDVDLTQALTEEDWQRLERRWYLVAPPVTIAVVLLITFPGHALTAGQATQRPASDAARRRALKYASSGYAQSRWCAADLPVCLAQLTGLRLIRGRHGCDYFFLFLGLPVVRRHQQAGGDRVQRRPCRLVQPPGPGEGERQVQARGCGPARTRHPSAVDARRVMSGFYGAASGGDSDFAMALGAGRSFVRA